MSSLYNHNHYGHDTGTCQKLLNKLPTISPRNAKIIASLYFISLYLITSSFVLFYDYSHNYNLHFFQIYYVLFFTCIMVVGFTSTIRQRYLNAGPITIPMWLLAITNALIFLVGIPALYSSIPDKTNKWYYCVYITALFNEFTLILVVIYSIYKTFFSTTAGFSGMGLGGNNNNYDNHQHYALASTGDVDVETDIELELDLYSPSDQYVPHNDSNEDFSYNNQNNNYSNNNNKRYATNNPNSINNITSINSLGNTDKNNNNMQQVRGTSINNAPKSPTQQQQPKRLEAPVPNFNIDLADEYTDIE